MKIIISGSIATDHLMTYPGRFTDALVGDQLENVSLSFLVDDLAIRRGGAGANIAFNLGCLGLSPMLVGAVGADFGEYGEWLSRHGVDVSGVQLSDSKHTARFLCTTDADQNQIASFYTGAMAEARDIELTPHVRRFGGVDVVLVGPNDPVAMLRHTDECRDRGYPFAADPSQQLALMDGGDIKQLVEGATYLFTNRVRARPAGAEDRLVERRRARARGGLGDDPRCERGDRAAQRPARGVRQAAAGGAQDRSDRRRRRLPGRLPRRDGVGDR